MKFAPVPRPAPDAMVLYRYDDGYRYNMETATQPVLTKLYVTKHTPKGYWVTDEFQILHKWAPNYGKKRYAYSTILEAAESYKHRKTKQLAILSNRIPDVKAYLEGAKQLVELVVAGVVPLTPGTTNDDEIPF